MSNDTAPIDLKESQYTLSVPTSETWSKRSDVVDHILEEGQGTPAYSQIINLESGERFNLLGERLHFLSDAQWSSLLNIITLTFLLTKKHDEEQVALRLMTQRTLNDFIELLPQRHQDDIVNRASLLLGANPEDLPNKNLLEPTKGDQDELNS